MVQCSACEKRQMNKLMHNWLNFRSLTLANIQNKNFFSPHWGFRQPCDYFCLVMYEQKCVPLPDQIIYFWWSISASFPGAVLTKCLSEISCQSTWLYKWQQWAFVNPQEACTINTENISFDPIESRAPNRETQTNITETKV